jgi:hypothetical protein
VRDGNDQRLIVKIRSRWPAFSDQRPRKLCLNARRGEQIQLLLAHSPMMGRPLGLSNAFTAAVHFSRPKLHGKKPSLGTAQASGSQHCCNPCLVWPSDFFASNFDCNARAT